MALDLQVINKILVLIINLIGIWLIFWVYSADRKKILNRGFALLVIPNLLWIDLYNLAFLTNQSDLTLLLTRATFAFVFIFFISFYYFFIIWFLEEKGWYFFIGYLVIIYEIFGGFLSIFTNLIIKDVKMGEWSVIPTFSDAGRIIFHFPIIILTTFIAARLLSKYLQFPKEKRARIQNFLVGVFIFILGNFIFGVILPFFFNVYDYYHLANYSSIFLLGLTAYAIVKNEFMGVKAILT